MTSGNTKAAGPRASQKKSSGTPMLEWIASAFGLLLAVGVVSLVVWDIFSQDGSPPAVLVERGDVTAYEGGFTLEIRARNASAETAAQVEIEGVLKQGNQTLETARSTIDFVPGKSERRAGLFFTRDPREFELQLRALGYAEP